MNQCWSSWCWMCNLNHKSAVCGYLFCKHVSLDRPLATVSPFYRGQAFRLEPSSWCLGVGGELITLILVCGTISSGWKLLSISIIPRRLGPHEDSKLFLARSLSASFASPSSSSASSRRSDSSQPRIQSSVQQDRRQSRRASS